MAGGISVSMLCGEWGEEILVEAASCVRPFWPPHICKRAFQRSIA